jgi:acyl-CoA thioesterase-2
VGDFALDTEITATGDREYCARLSQDWEIWGPNGGYVAAIALRAAGAASRFARPASYNGAFLSSARFDEVQIRVEVLRATRVADALFVRMNQGDRQILAALVWTVDEVEGLVHDAAPMPDVPPASEVRSLSDRLPQHRPPFPFWDNIDNRTVDWIEDWEGREPGEPRNRSWFRFQPSPTFDDPFVDAARSLLLIDTMGWPAAVRAYREPVGYVAPNLDLAASFHRLEPGSEWLYAESVAPVAADGLLGASTRVWSESGRLLASGGEQLLCRPVPAQA